MRRRAFLQLSGAVAAAPAQTLLLPDSATNPPGLEYYLLGNGLILAGIQSVSGPGSETNTGMVLTAPEHFNRKNGTLLWSPRNGLRNTRSGIVVNGVRYSPEAGGATFTWTYPDGVPTLRIEWQAGPCGVTEELFTPAGRAALLRTVAVENRGAEAVQVRLLSQLEANRLLFDEYEVDQPRMRVCGVGYHRLELSSLSPATARYGELETSWGSIAPGGRAATTLVLTLDEPQPANDVSRLKSDTAAWWRQRATIETGNAEADHLFRVASQNLRAAVARSGKMDGGIWQYNHEWVRDEVMVATGAVMAGSPEITEAILDRVLTRMVDDRGGAYDSGRARPAGIVELDQNGELLWALRNHWAWTGNDAIFRRHWPRVRATADYVLDPVFRDPEIGLLKNRREFWERDPGYGVLEGYELSYQAWNIAGLPMAAEMADHMGDAASAARWRAAAALMKKSFLTHPSLSLVEDGRFIKRRRVDGKPQFTMDPPNRAGLAPGMPLRDEKISYCDPDAASVFPIILDIVDPAGPLARKTLDSMETLWNQRWTTGGYGRYHVTSEPDSPGPWPFATLFIARAYLEAGDSAKVWRALHWLRGLAGGNSGAWFEFYGPRPVPPLPPVAIVPWTMAEVVMLFVHHLLGFRPSPSGLLIRPRLLDGLNEVEARLRCHGHEVRLKVRRAAPSERVDGPLRLPLPTRDLSIEMHV